MGRYHPGAMDIQLAVGVPPAHYGAQYQQFCAFFLNRGPVHFEYQGKKYTIVITEAVCYPQSYAAAVTMFQTLKRIPRALILDIGGVTVDYMQIKNGGVDISVSDSLESGVIMMYNKIISKVRAEQDIIAKAGFNDFGEGVLESIATDLANQILKSAYNGKDSIQNGIETEWGRAARNVLIDTIIAVLSGDSGMAND